MCYEVVKWANPPGRFKEWTSQTLEFTVKPVYQGHPWEMARWLLQTGWPLYTAQLCRKYKATENFGKLSGDRNIQGDRYTQGRYIKVWLYLQKHLASIFVLFFFLADFCCRYRRKQQTFQLWMEGTRRGVLWEGCVSTILSPIVGFK